jgi:hypothetical protein
MGDDNRFFRWLGRINAILFFLAVAGAIVLVGGESLIWSQPMRDTPVTAEAKKGNDTFSFGGTFGGPFVALGAPSITHLDGTDEGVMVLRRGGSRYAGFDSVSRMGGSGVNFLLIDLKTMKTRWLFDGVKRDIGRVFEVRSSIPMPQNSSDPVTALLMPVAAADTNGDDEITQADDHALYVYRVGSAKAVKLLDAKSISGMEQIDSDRIVISYYDGKTDHALLLSARTFAPIADTAVSPTSN